MNRFFPPVRKLTQQEETESAISSWKRSKCLHKYHYKAGHLDFSQRTQVNQWAVMNDPEHPIYGIDHTGLQAENMRNTVNKIIETVKHEESTLAGLM